MGSRPKIVMPPPPPPPPDYADQAIRDAAAGERTRQLAQGSRRRSFLGGLTTAASGQPPVVPVSAKRLLGA